MWNTYGSTNTYGGVTTSGGGETGGGVGTGETPAAISVPFTQSGMGRKLTKIGKLFRRPSGMSFREGYWNRFYRTDNFIGWPTSEYPWIEYESTDHDTGTGGCWARVYEKALGPIWDGNAWHEWQDVSDRTEFSHIEKKTNPIFVARLAQTETPQLLEHDGTLRFYYHENGSSGAQQGDPQSGFYASGTNGIDFKTAVLADYSYPQGYLTGEGHTGYGELGDNTFDNLSYKFIGTALQGGASEAYNNGQQIVAGDDAITWERLAYWRRINADLMAYNQAGEEDFVYPLDVIRGAKKEGRYYRVIVKYRPKTSGGNEASTRPCEILIDENFNAVSAPNFYFELGASGEFDESEAITPDEFEWEGKRYCTYKTVESDGYSSVGIAEVLDEPKDWTILYSYSDKQVPLNLVTDTNAASGLTYSDTTSVKTEVKRQLTSLNVPSSQAVSSAITTTSINLLTDDIVKVLFERIGKDVSDPLRLEFGVTDDLSNPTQKASLVFNARTEPDDVADSEKIVLETLGATSDLNELVDQYVGQSSLYNSRGNVESPFAKHDLGFRFIPAENLLSVMSGVTPIGNFSVAGFDYSIPMYIYIKANFTDTEPTEDGSVSFHSIRVETFDADQKALAVAPTASATATEDSVTVTSSSVSGAVGYKYFLNGIENRTGIFTDLPSGEDYEYYTRAITSDGDSEPSAIGVISTGQTQAPYVDPTAIAGPTQSVTAGAPVQLDASSSTQGTYPIASYEWSVSPLNAVNLVNGTTATPSFTAPTNDSAQTLTFSVVAIDTQGNRSEPASTSVSVAAEVDLTPPVITLTGGNVVLNIGETFQEPGFKVFDNKGVEITSSVTVTVTGSTETTYPRVGSLEYDVEVDGIRAETKTRLFTVIEVSELLEEVSKQKFTIEDKAIIHSFPGRSNLEKVRFKLASTNTNIALDKTGCYDFDENETQKVEVITASGLVSSESGDVEWEGGALYIRAGAFSSMKSHESARVVVYLANDERGVVFAGPGLPANLIIHFN